MRERAGGYSAILFAMIFGIGVKIFYHGDTVIVWEQVKTALSTVSIL